MPPLRFRPSAAVTFSSGAVGFPEARAKRSVEPAEPRLRVGVVKVPGTAPLTTVSPALPATVVPLVVPNGLTARMPAFTVVGPV